MPGTPETRPSHVPQKTTRPLFGGVSQVIHLFATNAACGSLGPVPKPNKTHVPQKDKPGFQVSWTTVTYRSVLLAILGIVVAISIVLYLLFPTQSKDLLGKVGTTVGGWLGSKAGNKNAGRAGQQSASFTMIDGTVRVKKANSNTWINADYTLPLDKGDVVQTGSEGIAKVVFADGTNYSIKQDSLIVIEENFTNTAQQTSVSVQLTTGTVDLSTGTYSQGSQSQVVLAGARASLAPDSSAMVRNDPRADEHEVLLKKGAGQIQRGTETMKLAEWERASFKSDSPKMTKQKELAPPTLIAPANMMPMFVAPGSALPIDFTWSPITTSHGYHIRVSRNPYFSSTVFDRKVANEGAKAPGLGEGAYYWTVQSVDANGRESVESEKNRFTIIAKATSGAELALELSQFVQHGHVIEVKGKTEPNARVMVNGAEVPVVQGDGTFQFFTPPLPNGENTITVTAQNAKGGVKTKQQKVVIQ